MERDAHSDSEIKKFYDLKNIAVVGMSKNEGKAAHYVPKYLIRHGYNVIPVNPTSGEIQGRKSYPAVSNVQDKIDIVDIFRPSEDVQAVVEDVLKKEGIKVIWMQEGIYSRGRAHGKGEGHRSGIQQVHASRARTAVQRLD